MKGILIVCLGILVIFSLSSAAYPEGESIMDYILESIIYRVVADPGAYGGLIISIDFSYTFYPDGSIMEICAVCSLEPGVIGMTVIPLFEPGEYYPGSAGCPTHMDITYVYDGWTWMGPPIGWIKTGKPVYIVTTYDSGVSSATHITIEKPSPLPPKPDSPPTNENSIKKKEEGPESEIEEIGIYKGPDSDLRRDPEVKIFKPGVKPGVGKVDPDEIKFIPHMEGSQKSSFDRLLKR